MQELSRNLGGLPGSLEINVWARHYGPGRMAAKTLSGQPIGANQALRREYPGYRKKGRGTIGEESDRLIVVLITGNLLEGTRSSEGGVETQNRVRER